MAASAGVLEELRFVRALNDREVPVRFKLLKSKRPPQAEGLQRFDPIGRMVGGTGIETSDPYDVNVVLYR